MIYNGLILVMLTFHFRFFIHNFLERDSNYDGEGYMEELIVWNMFMLSGGQIMILVMNFTFKSKGWFIAFLVFTNFTISL